VTNSLEPMYDYPWHGPNSVFLFTDDEGRYKKVLLLRYDSICRDAMVQGDEKDLELVKKGPGIYEGDELSGYLFSAEYVVVVDGRVIPEEEKDRFEDKIDLINVMYEEDIELDTTDVKEKV